MNLSSDQMKAQKMANKAESGSAIIYIFIGVALFGALMFMFSRGGSQNTSSLTGQQSSISASDYISRGRSLESGVQKVINAGCSENEISFDPPPYTANTNSNAPTDYHCHVFHPNGGKMNSELFSDWKFSSHASIDQAGTDYTEIIGYVDGLDATICQKINDLLENGFTTIPVESGYVFDAQFDGTSPTDLGTVSWIVSADTAARNKTSGCIDTDTHTPYIYYSTVLVR